MAEIQLVRQDAAPISDAARELLKLTIFGIVDGLGDVNRKKWRGFWSRLLKLEPGEMVLVQTHQARLGFYHRHHMLVEQRVFEAQERFDNFEQFRMWLKVGAGHVDWMPGPKGGVFPVPKTISYAKMEQGEFEAFHAAMLTFLQTEHAGRTLWKHLSPERQREMIDTILANAGAFEM